MTEKDCLDYCYKNNFFWKEGNIRLYDVLDRVSCWCCANKNMKELRNYKRYLPEYYERFLKLAYEIWVNAKNEKLKDVSDKFLTKFDKIESEEE